MTHDVTIKQWITHQREALIDIPVWLQLVDHRRSTVYEFPIEKTIRVSVHWVFFVHDPIQRVKECFEDWLRSKHYPKFHRSSWPFVETLHFLCHSNEQLHPHRKDEEKWVIWTKKENALEMPTVDKKHRTHKKAPPPSRKRESVELRVHTHPCKSSTHTHTHAHVSGGGGQLSLAISWQQRSRWVFLSL